MRSKAVPTNFVSISQAAYEIDASVNTIKRWYSWFENGNYEKPEGLELPKYYHFDAKGTKYFDKSAVEALKEFQTKLKTSYRGCMAEYTKKEVWRKE